MSVKRFFNAALMASAVLFVTGAAQAVDTVVTKVIRNTNGHYSFLFGNASDGTGEAAVIKVSTASLTGLPTRLQITKIKWAIQGMAVAILYDASTDDRVAILTGDGQIDEGNDGPIIDPQSSGHTGNVLFTTYGASSGDGYTIYMELKAVN